MQKLIRYHTLVSENNLPKGKMADALYEIGSILYKDMGNRQKAVGVFTRISDQFAESYHAADARFTVHGPGDTERCVGVLSVSVPGAGAEESDAFQSPTGDAHQVPADLAGAVAAAIVSTVAGHVQE